MDIPAVPPHSPASAHWQQLRIQGQKQGQKMNHHEELATLLGDDFQVDDGLVNDRQGYYVADIEDEGRRVNTSVSLHIGDEEADTLTSAAEQLDVQDECFRDLGFKFDAGEVHEGWLNRDPSIKALTFVRTGVARTDSIAASAELIRRIARLDRSW